MPENQFQEAEVPLDRDLFMRSLIRTLAGTLEEVVGLDDASGFISVVGQEMGATIGADYRKAAGKERLSREEVADALVDLKRRIAGDFYVIEQDDEKIVLGNRACPFGPLVEGRPSMCMMTSNVFGAIAAENLGYARVDLEETIADGHDGCRVVVHLRRGQEGERQVGREYYRAVE